MSWQSRPRTEPRAGSRPLHALAELRQRGGALGGGALEARWLLPGGARRGRQAISRAQLAYAVLLLAALSLVAFGLVMVFSASSARKALANGDPYDLLLRQAIFAGAGVAGMLVLSRVPFQRLRHLAAPFLLTAYALLAAVLVLGDRVNGATRWFTFGWLNLQPSELAKLALVVWVGWILARRRRPPATLRELANPVGVAVALAVGLVLLQPDMGTAIIIALSAGAVILVSGTRLRLLGLVGGVAFALGWAAIWFSDYRRERFLSFLNPQGDPSDSGYQAIHAELALGSGGLLGRGLGESVEKVNYLPESSTDMIAAVIGEELGFVGIVAVVLAFGALVWAGTAIAIACRDPFGKRVAIGITTLIGSQAALNLFAVMGLAPLTGIPLPFVSYGGSSLIVCLLGVGILLNIAQQDERATVSMRDRGRRDGRARAAGSRDRGGAARPRRPRELRGAG